MSFTDRFLLLTLIWYGQTSSVPFYQNHDGSQRQIEIRNMDPTAEPKHYRNSTDIVWPGHMMPITVPCPKVCFCLSDKNSTIIAVDCSGKHLTAVPALPPTASRVSLRNNSISNVSCSDFYHLGKLIDLDLSWNRIHQLQDCVFSSQGNLLTLDMSRCRLNTVNQKTFHNLINLKVLDLSHNEMKRLEPRMFANLNMLNILSLSYNQLSHIGNDTFYGLGSLRHLTLRNNALVYNTSTFEANAFHDLGSLEVLHIQSNNVGYKPDLDYPDTALSVLTNLAELHMDGLPLPLGNGFRSLTNLSLFDIGTAFAYRDSYCHLGALVPENFFENIITQRSLTLNLSNCGLSQLPPLLFAFVPNITSLDLSYNPQISVDGFEKGSWGLANSSLTYLNLTRTMKINGDVTAIKKSTFRYLKGTKLKLLDLSDNSLYKVSPRAILDLPITVEHLTLRDNSIQEGDSLPTLLYLRNLKTLDIGNQLHYRVTKRNEHSRSTLWDSSSDFNPRPLLGNGQRPKREPESVKKQTNGDVSVLQNASDQRPPNQTSDLHETEINGNAHRRSEKIEGNKHHAESDIVKEEIGNNLTTVEENFKSHSASEEDTESDHILKCLGSNEFARPSNVFLKAGRASLIVPLPKSLQTVYADHMNMDYAIPSVTVINNDVLRFIDYSGNEAHCWEGPIKNVPSLQIVDLSHNSCDRMSMDVFKYMTNLTTLFLHQNFLGDIFTNDHQGRIFSKLTMLEVLDLRHNSLKDLSVDAFINNPNLKRLLLSHNTIAHFNPSLKNIRGLDYLDLSVNTLHGLSDDTCKDLLVLRQKNENITVNVQRNRLVCSCEFLSFLLLVVEAPDLFTDVEQLNFQMTNGSALPYSKLADFLPYFQKQCLAEAIFLYIVILFCLVVGTVAMAAIFSYNQWKLTYLLHVGRRHMRIGATPITYRPLAQVFIIYDEEDIECRQFMQRTFLPRLQEREVTYVLGEVDFEGGHRVPQMLGAIVGTNRTLLVLSDEIFEDPERRMEVRLAIMHELHTNTDLIVPVLVGHVDVREFPPEIRTFLQNQCHRLLRYEDSENFWSQLSRTLRQTD